MKTSHGYDIIESYKIDQNRVLVLVERQGHLDNWVTWTMNIATGECVNGEYCSSLEMGRKSFNRRKEVFTQLNKI